MWIEPKRVMGLLVCMIGLMSCVMAAENKSVCGVAQSALKGAMEWHLFWQSPYDSTHDDLRGQTTVVCGGSQRIRFAYARRLHLCMLYDKNAGDDGHWIVIEACRIRNTSDITRFVRQFGQADLGLNSSLTAEELRQFETDISEEDIRSAGELKEELIDVPYRPSVWDEDINTGKERDLVLRTVRTEVSRGHCPCKVSIPRFRKSDPYVFVLVEFRTGERSILRIVGISSPLPRVSYFVIRSNDPSFEALATLIESSASLRESYP